MPGGWAYAAKEDGSPTYPSPDWVTSLRVYGGEARHGDLVVLSSDNSIDITNPYDGHNSYFDFTVDVASLDVVRSLNNLTGDLTIAGENISVSAAGSTITLTGPAPSSATPADVASSGSAGSSTDYARADHVHRGVTSITHDTAAYGAITLAEGTNITITQSGSTFTFSASGGGGGVTSLNNLTGDLALSAGTGISISDNGSDTITITNDGVTQLNNMTGQIAIQGAGTVSVDSGAQTITITGQQEVPDNPSTGAILEYDTTSGRQWQEGFHAGDLLVFDGSNWGLFAPEGQGDGYFYWDDETNQWSIQAGGGGGGLPAGDLGDLLRHNGTDWQSWGAPGPGYLVYGAGTDQWGAFGPPASDGGVLAWSGTDLFWLQGSTVGGLLHWNGTGWEEFGNESGGQLLQSAGANGLQWLWGDAGQICYNDGSGWGAWGSSGTEIVRGDGMGGWEAHGSGGNNCILKGDGTGGWEDLTTGDPSACRLLATNDTGALVYLERPTQQGTYRLRLTVNADGSAAWSWVSDT